MTKKKIELKCPLCEGKGCFDDFGEGFYIFDNKLRGTDSKNICDIGPLDINFCPLCGRSLKVVSKLQQIENDFK